MKPFAKKMNSLKKLHPSQEESPTLEPKVRTSFFTTWRDKEKDFKLCVTSTITRAYKDSTKFTLNSEEVISLEWLVNQAEPKEVSFRSPQEKYSFSHHVFTCYQKSMSVLRINNQDTERDIWTWLWTKKLDKHSSWDQKSSVLSEDTWTTWTSCKSKLQWWTWSQVEPLQDHSSLITMISTWSFTWESLLNSI